MQLFQYRGKLGVIDIRIGKEIQFAARQVPKLGTVRESLISNNVHFNFLGFNFNNSFPALSSLEALLTVFIRKRFGQNKHVANVRFSHRDKLCVFFAEKVPQGNGQLPFLKLGLEETDKHVFMNETYAFLLTSSLKKAANWLAPAHNSQ